MSNFEIDFSSSGEMIFTPLGANPNAFTRKTWVQNLVGYNPADGYLHVNFIPRADTYANLKALVGGQGEIGSLTNVAGIIQFNGPFGSGTASVYSPMMTGIWNETYDASLNSTLGTFKLLGNGTTTLLINGQNNNSAGVGSGDVTLAAGSNTAAASFGANVNLNAGTGTAGGGNVQSSISSGGNFKATFTGLGNVMFNDNGNTRGFLYGFSALAANDVLGFFSKGILGQGVVQQTATAGGTGTAGTGTAVLVQSAFDGGLGGSAYTIGQIVKALKNYGLLAA